MPYVVTKSRTLHRYPALERCNLDDAVIFATYEDLPSASATLKINARPCAHCKPFDPHFTAPLPKTDV